MRVTVKEIAERAGVSPSTVSRIISGRGGVAEEKREQVKAVLKQLAQKPDSRRVSSLARNIGVLIPPHLELDQRVILEKLEILARSLPPKWNLLLLSPEIVSYELESRYLRGELSGLILFGYGVERNDLGGALKQIPHIWMNSHRNADQAKSILMGNELAGRLAARYLLEHRCRKTAVLVAESLNPGFSARIDGFRFEYFTNALSCRELALPFKLQRQKLEVCHDADLEAALTGLLDREPLVKYDGIFSPEERLTPLLYRVCRKAGYARLPLIISCNHTPEYLAGLYPRPASIDLGAQTVAEMALKELFRRIAGAPERADNIAVITTPQIVPGDPPIPRRRGGDRSE